MTESERIAALEEKLLWLQHELEQLDATIQGQAAGQDRLAQQLARIERRLERIERGADGTGEPGQG